MISKRRFELSMNVSLVKKYGIPSANLACDILTGTITPKSILTAGTIIITFADDIDSIKKDDIREYIEIIGDSDHIQAIKILNTELEPSINKESTLIQVKTLLISAVGKYRVARKRLKEKRFFFNKEKYAKICNKEIICLLERAYCCLLMNENELCNLNFIEAKEVFYHYIELVIDDLLNKNREIYIYEDSLKDDMHWAFPHKGHSQEILTSAKEIEKQEKQLLEIAKILNICSWKPIYTLSKEYKKISEFVPLGGKFDSKVSAVFAVYEFK